MHILLSVATNVAAYSRESMMIILLAEKSLQEVTQNPKNQLNTGIPPKVKFAKQQ